MQQLLTTMTLANSFKFTFTLKLLLGKSNVWGICYIRTLLVYVKIQLKTTQCKYNSLTFLTAKSSGDASISTGTAGFRAPTLVFWQTGFIFRPKVCPSWWQDGSSSSSRRFPTFLRKDSLWLPGSNWTLCLVLDQPPHTAGWSMLTDSGLGHTQPCRTESHSNHTDWQ